MIFILHLPKLIYQPCSLPKQTRLDLKHAETTELPCPFESRLPIYTAKLIFPYELVQSTSLKTRTSNFSRTLATSRDILLSQGVFLVIYQEDPKMV